MRVLPLVYKLHTRSHTVRHNLEPMEVKLILWQLLRDLSASAKTIIKNDAKRFTMIVLSNGLLLLYD